MVWDGELRADGRADGARKLSQGRLALLSSSCNFGGAVGMPGLNSNMAPSIVMQPSHGISLCHAIFDAFMTPKRLPGQNKLLSHSRVAARVA